MGQIERESSAPKREISPKREVFGTRFLRCKKGGNVVRRKTCDDQESNGRRLAGVDWKKVALRKHSPEYQKYRNFYFLAVSILIYFDVKLFNMMINKNILQ